MNPTNSTTTNGPALVRKMEAFFNAYLSFPNAPEQYPFTLALWCAATYLHQQFDAFPYLVITSDTKRSGKTRLSELLAMLASNPQPVAGVTAASLLRLIRDAAPTLIIDEAETASSEAASILRSVLNVGYRKGQTVPRADGTRGVIQWPTYCPKVFVLIGDVYDTLRDRSVVVRMRRGDAPQRFVHAAASAEAKSISADLKVYMELDGMAAAVRWYNESAGLPFLPDRDEEIWHALFAACAALDPSRMEELQRAAVDLSMDKTAPARRYTELYQSEEEAENDEFARRLLLDMVTVCGKGDAVYTADALDQLKALPTGPWRKFRGVGLTMHDLANLLSRFGVRPVNVRTKGGRANSKVVKGYKRDALVKAAEQFDHDAESDA